MGMSQVDKKILEEVEFLQDKYFTFDQPVPFCGLFLYPILTKDYNEFIACSACLTLNKNDDIKGIRMSHLEYLISKMNDEKDGQLWCFKFSRLIELVFRIKNGLKCNKCGKTITYDEYFKHLHDNDIDPEDEEVMRHCIDDDCDGTLFEIVGYKKNKNTQKISLVVDGKEITNEDFIKFRKYVLYQNLPDYKDDSWVDKAVRDDQEKRQQMLSKDYGNASLERKILCVCAKSNYKINEIFDMPMRKFIMLLGIIQDAMDYQITKTGLMSGMVSLKKGQTIDHWIYKKDQGMYAKAVDADAYASQIQNT